MADYPADVGCGPIDLARLRVSRCSVCSSSMHRMSTIVTDDALCGGGSRGVEDIKWIGRLDRDRGKLLRAIMRCMPFDITPFNKSGGDGLTLIDDAGAWLVPCEGDGLIQKWLVFDNSVGFMPARRADYRLRLAIINTLGKLGRSKPTKTTEWTAPRQAQPSMAITASGIIGI